MKDLNQDILDWLRYCEQSSSEIDFRSEAIEDYKFYAGKQDTQEVLDILAEQKRPATVYNEIAPKINMLVGLAAQTKNVVTVSPKGLEDSALAELMSGVIDHYKKKIKLARKELDCFDHSLKAGRSLLHWSVNTSNPEDVKFICSRISGLDFWLDPGSVEYDLSDARFIFMNKWLTKKEVETYYPEIEISQLTSFPALSGGISFYDNVKDMYRFVECWYKEPALYHLFYNPLTGKLEKLIPKEHKIYLQQLQQGIKLQDGSVYTATEDDIKFKKIYEDDYYYSIFTGMYEVAGGRSSFNYRGFPCTLFGAYKDDDINRWYGVVNAMKDPQRGVNVMLRQLQHLLQTLPKGIPIWEAGVVLNAEEYAKRSSDPTYYMEVERGGIDRVKFQAQPPISPVYGNLYQIYAQSMKNTSGVQNELLGIQQSSRESGVSVHARQETGLAVLYTLFDNYRESRFHNTEILMSFIQQYVTEPTVIRIEGMQGQQLIQINTQMNPQTPGFNDISAGQFDLELDEVVMTGTMRNSIAQLLIEYSHNNPGMIPPDLILEYSDIPFSAKQRVQQTYMQQSQSAQEAAQFDRSVQLKELELKEEEIKLKYGRDNSSGSNSEDRSNSSGK